MPNKINFTDRTLSALPLVPAMFWDLQRNPASFGIRVGRLTKTFIVVMHGGHRIKLGHYPHVSLQEARTKAKLLLANPTKTKARKVVPKIAAAVEDFLQHHAIANKPRTTLEYCRLLTKHFLAPFGTRPADQLTAGDILGITDKLLETPAEAIHAHAAMKRFYTWAVEREIVPTSPMTSLGLPAKPGKRERILTDQELASVYRAAQQMGHPFGYIVLVCIHTLLRRSNVGALRWSYITPDAITIPAHEMKNGKLFTLPNLIGENLSLIPKKDDLIFASAAGTPFSAWSKNKTQLDRISGVTDYVLHDLRRTGASKLAEWKIAPPHVIERILGHITGESMTPLARIYNRHSYAEEVRDALTKYEAHLSSILST